MGEIDLHIRNIHEVHRETLVQKYLRLILNTDDVSLNQIG